MRIADNSLRSIIIGPAHTVRRIFENDPAPSATSDVNWQTLFGSDDKAAARTRLLAAKDLLEVLERWGFPPHVIAREAEALGKVVAKAAADFSAAAMDGVQSAEPAIVSLESVTLETTFDNGGSTSAEEMQNNESRWSALPGAYQDVLGPKEDFSKSSSDDSATMSEFQSVSNRIKALLRRAMKEMRAEDVRPLPSKTENIAHPSYDAKEPKLYLPETSQG